MTNKLFVRGLPYSVDNQKLTEYFAQAGTVVSANVIMDRMTNQSKGFGFVEMSSSEEAKQAINSLSNTDLEGRTITVQEAKPQEDRPSNQGSRGSWDRGSRDSRGNNR